MFNSPCIITGLEIGTSKVCAITAKVTDDGTLNVVGLGQAPSRGVRKGEIVEAQQVAEDVRDAIADAETMADVEIQNVYLAVSGAHVRSFNNRGQHPILSHDRPIGSEDLADVTNNAKAFHLPGENVKLHVIRQHYLVDGQTITNPVGMFGGKLELDIHVIHGSDPKFRTAINAVTSLHLQVNSIVFSGLASALALLSPQQKQAGVLLIDMGGGTTDYVVYRDGVMKHSGVLAVGGDHVSNDLGCGLKIPLRRAEELKIEFGSAICEQGRPAQVVTFPSAVGLPDKTLDLEKLHRIMSLRLTETFQIIAEQLQEFDVLPFLREGVVLCGGGARIPGIQQLAQSIFQLPVSVGKSESIAGLKSALDQPEFAAPLGLVRFGYMEMRNQIDNKPSFRRTIRGSLTSMFRRN